MPSDDRRWMDEAYALAVTAEQAGEVPVGAVIVQHGQVIGRGANAPIAACDPSAHAEVIAIRDACRTENNYRLSDCTLYVTLEPCPMCVGLIHHARISRVVFGAADPKSGALGGKADLRESGCFYHHLVQEGPVDETRSGGILKRFFEKRRSDSRGKR